VGFPESRSHGNARRLRIPHPPRESWGRITVATITKKQLIDRIADQTGTTRTGAKIIVQMFLDEIIEELSKGNRIEFRDFGVFEVRERAARTAQNPKTLERVEVPEKRGVKFKAGRRMKDVMDAATPEVVITNNGRLPAPRATANHRAG
jgi:integration host factor subunit beta